MDLPPTEAWAERLGRLERENRRWRRATGGAALAAALLLAGGGRPGPRAAGAQPMAPPPARMEYVRSAEFAPEAMAGVLAALAAEGWEVLQVVPTAWATGGEASGYYTKFVAQAGATYTRFVALARRPAPAAQP